jgi:hypothetical protein
MFVFSGMLCLWSSAVTYVPEKSAALVFRYTIKIDAVGISETLVTICEITQCYTNCKQTCNLCRYTKADERFLLNNVNIK